MEVQVKVQVKVEVEEVKVEVRDYFGVAARSIVAQPSISGSHAGIEEQLDELVHRPAPFDPAAKKVWEIVQAIADRLALGDVTLAGSDADGDESAAEHAERRVDLRFGERSVHRP